MRIPHQPSETPRFSFRSTIIALCFVSLLAPANVQAQDSRLETLQNQVEALIERLESLEQRNVELERKLMEAQMRLEPTVEAVDEIRVKLDEAMIPAEAAPQPVDTGKKPVLSTYGAELYGYLKVDAIYNTARMNTGNYAIFVKPDDPDGKEDEFHLTANQTRFGLNLVGPDLWGGESSGKIEVDFYGGGDENKARLRMRHAYGQVYWPEYDLAFLAGQTWDVISPLWPNTVNFLPGFGAGNLGFRRPQLRLTKGFDVTDDSRLEFQTALTRTIGETIRGVDTGSDSGFPTVQSRLGYAFPLLTDRPTVIGVSGHFGQEKYATGGNDDIYDSWSINMDFRLPLFEKIALLAEIWHGENLGDYLGGVVQGVNTQLGESIPASGGWASLALGPWNDFSFNLGALIDDPRESKIAPLGRTRNQMLFGNVMYELAQNLTWGLELSYWETHYKDIDNVDAIRMQTSLMYRF